MSHTLHPLRRQRVQRSQLAVPASSEKMLAKAAQSAADCVFLDLEDAVAPPEKEQARANAIKAINELDWSGKTVTVRVNGLDTEWCHRDLLDVMNGAGEKIDGFVIPKVGRSHDIYFCDALITQVEAARKWEKRVHFEIIIETALGMANVEEICRFGALECDRLEAIHFGVADYTASLRARTVSIGGLNPDYPGDQFHFALSRMVVAARAYGIRVIDGPFGDFSNQETYVLAAKRAAALGCEGKWAIHPSQIALANDIFSPSEKEVDTARRIVEALREAEAKGLGAATLDGKMIDAASEKMARNVIVVAEAIEAAKG